ncbi:MAG: glyoxalase [Armatimonadetes bacterium]|jgi:uncharacterized glyoxalase superfamily protein PhnB|nr:glyoxalase [Armatimonadota bacterium]
MADQTLTVTPHLCCRNGMEAMEFYQKAFGAVSEMAMQTPDGRLMHGSLNISGARVFVTDEWPEQGGLSPLSLNGSPVTLHLQVSDCDAVFQRAVDAGCEVRVPLDDMFWGDRYGIVRDPFGHQWSIATTTRQVDPEELRAAAAQGCTGGA